MNRTNFYSEGGGQIGDTGKLISDDDQGGEISFKINSTINLLNYTLHVGKFESKSYQQKLAIGDEVMCKIDAEKRYSTSLNHTGVHILNHSLRSYFKNENSIRQTSSLVRDNLFKFEFSFTNSLEQLNINDLISIQSGCNQLIQKNLPVYSIENVVVDTDLDTLGECLNYPLRKLSDVLYPIKLRIVSIGKAWNEFQKKVFNSTRENNHNHHDYSAELCCGTHATQTGLLKKILIRNFEIVGDSNFLLECCTSKRALEMEENDKKALAYLDKIIKLHSQINESKFTLDILKNLERISRISIDIEKLFQSKNV